MFTTITAKRAGTCKRCGRNFNAGTRIRFGGRNLTYHLSAECPTGKRATTTTAGDDDGRTETEQRASHVTPNAVSDHYQIGGRDFYRNKRGRCEDAPCCGCCTI